MNRTVIGRHVYAGGFMLGVQQAGWKPLLSSETWPDPAPLFNRILPNIPRVRSIEGTMAEITIGNPPCSRFSHMSYDKFNAGDRSQLIKFPELQSVLRVGVEANSHTIWWETGPLAYKAGCDLVAAAHKELEAIWGRCNTLMVFLDTAWTGLPQQRPRTHIVHTKYPLPESLIIPQKRSIRDLGFVGIFEYVQRDTVDNPLVHRMEDNRWIGKYASAKEYIHNEKMHPERGFNATKPLLIGEEDQVVNAIISGRLLYWKNIGRWWELPEYATVMSYPTLQEVDYYAVAKNPVKTLMYLAKSVTPCAASFMVENVLEQIYNEQPLKERLKSIYYREMPLEIDECSGIRKLDLSTGTRVHKRFSHSRDWLS
jgi:hypothetical protein